MRPTINLWLLNSGWTPVEIPLETHGPDDNLGEWFEQYSSDWRYTVLQGRLYYYIEDANIASLFKLTFG